MKKSIFCIITLSLLFSCTKHVAPAPEAVNAPPVMHNISSTQLKQAVYNLKYTGKWSDTSWQAQPGGIVEIGDSYTNRQIYANWDLNWKTYQIINRGIGGTTNNELFPYIDSLVTCYQPKIIVWHMGNNEYLRHAGTNPTNRDVARTLLPSFNKFYDTLRARNPQATIIMIPMLTCPFLYKRGYNPDIANVTNTYPVPYPVAGSWSIREKVKRDSNAVYLDLRAGYPYNNYSLWETDSIHPKLTSYTTQWYNKLKPVIDSIYAAQP